MLDYERLDVYRVSLDLFSEVVLLAGRVPRGWGSVADQMRRAALSVPLNIAEAMGRYDVGDRRRHLNFARGSAMECAALIDVYARLPGATAASTGRPKEFARRVVAMLTKLGAVPRAV